MNNIKKTIKQLRKKKGLTQMNIAKRLHIARSTYSKLESGNTILDYEKLVNISIVLDVPVTEIIKENGDPVSESISEEFFLMLLQTNDQLSEKLLQIVPYDNLTPKQFELLKQKGLDNRDNYENTPLGGRIYQFGPRDVFRFMVNNCGMDVLFKRNFITDTYWTTQWKEYFNYDKNEIEIDDKEYFLVYMFLLKFNGDNEKYVQFAERDFPEGTDELGALEYLKTITGALDGNIVCFMTDGYDPVTEIVK